MKPDEREVVDLRRYRSEKAKAARVADAKAQEARRRGEQPILGSRPGAAVIVVLLIAVFVAAWLAPKLF